MSCRLVRHRSLNAYPEDELAEEQTPTAQDTALKQAPPGSVGSKAMEDPAIADASAAAAEEAAAAAAASKTAAAEAAAAVAAETAAAAAASAAAAQALMQAHMQVSCFKSAREHPCCKECIGIWQPAGCKQCISSESSGYAAGIALLNRVIVLNQTAT